MATEIGALDVDCDLTDMSSIEVALAQVKREAGDVSILVQNAGIGESAPFAKTTDEMWNRAMALNVTAAFRVARAVVPEMVAAKWGRVVNVASIAGLVGQAYVERVLRVEARARRPDARDGGRAREDGRHRQRASARASSTRR